MVPGGSKNKGSAFERNVCADLSMWVSEGERKDIFNRNVLSGGVFTRALKADGQLNTPGDIIAGHPLAFKFMELFCVECKHRKAIELDRYLLDTANKSFLAKTFKQTREQAERVHLNPLVIAKQNHFPTVVLMSYAVGMEAGACTRSTAFHFHVLHNNSIVLTSLHHLITLVRVKPFLDRVKRLSR